MSEKLKSWQTKIVQTSTGSDPTRKMAEKQQEKSEFSPINHQKTQLTKESLSIPDLKWKGEEIRLNQQEMKRILSNQKRGECKGKKVRNELKIKTNKQSQKPKEHPVPTRISD